MWDDRSDITLRKVTPLILHGVVAEELDDQVIYP